MAVEVTLNIDETNKKRNYPYVGRHDDGQVVFFVGENSGVSLTKDTIKIGNPFVWNEDVFTPLSPSESITLRNV